MGKAFFGAIGLICAATGFVGIFVPVLPTTPLLLLATICFAKSSPRLAQWLEQTNAYQVYVKPFKDTGGIPLSKKLHILILSYAVMAISAIIVQRPLVWGILAAVAVFLLWLMLVRIPTVDAYVMPGVVSGDHITGVLLINTGTPDSPDEEAIACYLDEFLMDPAIIGAPWPIRRVIVNKIISTRPKETAEKYRSFWTEEGSPFLNICLEQGDKLQEQLGRENMRVAVAMRYGNPSIESALMGLKEDGCTRLVVIPCYPQFVKVCAGTCFKAVRKNLAKIRWYPVLVEINDFYRQPCYREALADSVRKCWIPSPDSKLVVSCHSTLLKDIEHGDPYRDQVEETVANLVQDLGISDEMVVISYQSRFDNRKWLQPSTESRVVELAQEGTSVAVVCPVFVADNIETVVEVDTRLRALYVQYAPEGCSFTYIPCLNVDPRLIKALEDSIHEAIGKTIESE